MIAAPRAATSTRVRREGRNAAPRASAIAAPWSRFCSQSSPPHRPQTLNGVTRSDWYLTESRQNGPRSWLSRTGKHHQDDADGEGGDEGGDRSPAGRRVGPAQQQRGQRERGELGHAGQGRHGPPAGCRADDQQGEHQRRRHQAVVCVGVQGVERERIRRPAVGQQDAQGIALQLAPEQEVGRRRSAGRRRSRRRGRLAANPRCRSSRR